MSSVRKIQRGLDRNNQPSLGLKDYENSVRKLAVQPRDERDDRVLIAALESFFSDLKDPTHLKSRILLHLKLCEYHEAIKLHETLRKISDHASPDVLLSAIHIIHHLPNNPNFNIQFRAQLMRDVSLHKKDKTKNSFFLASMAIINLLLKMNTYGLAKEEFKHLLTEQAWRKPHELFSYLTVESNLPSKVAIMQALYLEEINVGEAFALYEKIEKDHPKCWDAYLHHAWFSYSHGRSEEASNLLNKVIAAEHDAELPATPAQVAKANRILNQFTKDSTQQVKPTVTPQKKI